MSVTTVSQETFRDQVLSSDRPVLVDFYADWCGPCRNMASVLNEVAVELGEGVRVVKINIDESPELAQEYQIQSIPTFTVIKAGQAVGQLVGMQTKQQLVDAVG